VFNNSAGEFAGGFDTTIALASLPRVSSVATEPSYLVRSLVPSLVVLVSLTGAQAASRDGGHKLVLGLGGGLLIAATLLSSSTLGLFALSAVVVGFILGVRRYRWQMVAAIATIGGATWYAADGIPLLPEVIDEIVISKFDRGSGLERAESIASGFEAFEASPLVGAGPGLETSHDLLVKLLSNFGLVGALFFLLAIASLLITSGRLVREKRGTEWHGVLIALTAGNAVLWLMDFVGGISYQYGIFWVLWGLLTAAFNGCALDTRNSCRSEDGEPRGADDAAGVRDHDRTEWIPTD